MGTEFFAVNDTKRQFVDMGRVGLHDDDVIGADHGTILERIAYYEHRLPPNEVERLADCLHVMGVERVLADTVHDFSQVIGYTCVGTIYTKHTPWPVGTEYYEEEL
jgi:hypothetical protein